MTESADLTGRVFDIKSFAVHDGPGIRTTVFMKGCSLSCVWCHNPEAISARPEMAFHEARCISCGVCVEVCPEGAQALTDEGERRYARDLCVQCGECIEHCHAEAMVVMGSDMTLDEVMTEVRKDAPFYAHSGGGVTVSGGEPLLQGRFVKALLERCKAEGLHTAVDTCGLVTWETFADVLPYVDLVLYDLKHADTLAHREATGSRNEMILENLEKLGKSGVAIEIRMPIVPTINDRRDDIVAAAEILSRVDNITCVRLLPYHGLAREKYRSVGRSLTLPDVASPEHERLEEIAGWMQPFGLNIILPSVVSKVA